MRRAPGARYRTAFWTIFWRAAQVDRAVNLPCVWTWCGTVSFSVLTVPKDDTAEYGYAALDQMAIAKRVRELRLPDRVFVYPGADEVGSVLFARVFKPDPKTTARAFT